MQRILSALSNIRIPSVIDEYGVHDYIEKALVDAGIDFKREAKLAPRCRVDFLCENGIALEVKCGRPPRKELIEQLRRYSLSSQVNALILVAEGRANMPTNINGKPCVLFGLRRLWGVAL